jgi:hypothetical protein
MSEPTASERFVWHCLLWTMLLVVSFGVVVVLYNIKCYLGIDLFDAPSSLHSFDVFN